VHLLRCVPRAPAPQLSQLAGGATATESCGGARGGTQQHLTAGDLGQLISFSRRLVHAQAAGHLARSSSAPGRLPTAGHRQFPHVTRKDSGASPAAGPQPVAWRHPCVHITYPAEHHLAGNSHHLLAQSTSSLLAGRSGSAR
jgi:hypothetical protein